MGDDEGLEIARITIVRVMHPGDVIDTITAVDGDGDQLGLAEALGMMRLAEDTLIRSRMEDDED